MAVCATGGSAAASVSAAGDLYVFGADSPLAVSHDYQQQHPQTSGSIAVWDDARPGGGPENPMRIFYKDLTKDDPEQPLVEIPGRGSTLDGEFSPAISGNLVAWLVGSSSYVNSIHYMFLGDGCPGADGCDHTLAIPGAKPLAISVSGRHIIWQDQRGGIYQDDIYMYDLDNPSLGEQPLVTTPGDDGGLAADGDWLVWVHDENFMVGRPQINDVFAKNLATGEIRQITSDGSAALQEGLSISGNSIVWDTNSPVPDNAHKGGIWLYDLASGQTRQLVSNGGSAGDHFPQIQGDKIVWLHSPASGGYEIWLYDLAREGAQEVSENTGTWQSSAAISSDGYILWQDQRQGARAIYKNRIGDTAQSLADKFKPELKLARGESFWPMPTEQFLASPGTALTSLDGQIYQPDPSLYDVASCSSISPDCTIDLGGSAIDAMGGSPSNHTDPAYVFERYAAPYFAGRHQYPAAMYARVVSRPPGNTDSFIQYWLLYYANDHPQAFHEGDWELIQIDLDAGLQPYKAEYSQHGGGQWRNWDGSGGVERSGSGMNHPVAYVARGSHANYFYPAEHIFYDLDLGAYHFQVADTAYGDGAALNDPGDPEPGKSASDIVIPEVDQSYGNSFAWLQYKGLWGEYTGAWLGADSVDVICCERDGSQNPPVQNYWTSAFAWSAKDDSCDGCGDQSARGTDIEATVLSPVDLNLYDAQGRHTGKTINGGIDEQIPGSEYLEYPELHRKSIVIHGGDIHAGYRLEANGTGAGAAKIIITAPDHAGNRVETLDYNDIQVNPSTRISMNLDSAGDFVAAIDTYGDGSDVIRKAPDTKITNSVDFIPPGRITDLAVTATSSGTATLSFTAPGDDGEAGAAAAYDLRYSTAAITDQYWSNAKPAGNLPSPLPAGTVQSVTVSGLNAGTTYFFALKAMDKAGQFSPASNVSEAATAIPRLNWTLNKAYWASLGDYDSGQLSADYNLGNSGTGIARSAAITESVCSPSSVDAVTPLPLAVGDLAPDTSTFLTLKYRVPAGIARFLAFTYASCQDDAGRSYQFPGPKS